VQRWLEQRNLQAQTTARVVSVHEGNDDGEVLHQPTVTFLADDGRERSFTGRFRAKIAVGDSINVRYDPSSPPRALLDGDELSFPGLLLGFSVGIAFAFLPTVALIGLIGSAAQAAFRQRRLAGGS
jgi:hypothetical protein